MKYKHIFRCAQIVFLVIIPKKLIHASSLQEHVYYKNAFTSADSCELVQKTSFPFYVIQEDLFSDTAQIVKGSFVTLSAPMEFTNEKPFRVIKMPHKNDTLPIGLQNLHLENVDIPTNWTFLIHEPKDSPMPLQNKKLQLDTDGQKINYRRCCSQSKCTDLPVFGVFDSHTRVGKIAFLPSATDFISTFSAQKNKSSAVPIEKSLPQKPQSDALLKTPLETTSPPVELAQQKIICTQNTTLRIYDESLKSIVYNAPKFLPVKIFQDWNGGPSEKTIKGHVLVKVQLTTGSGKDITGFAASSYIKPASECKNMPLIYSDDGKEDLIPGATVFVDSPKNCCRFPTLVAPNQSYQNGSGLRYFGARRKGGARSHAAADLLRPEGEKVLAIDGGKILRKYSFYGGTYALEVKHDNGYLARYGEVQKKDIAHSEFGTRIVKGQHIGNIGSYKMLHFELFSDKATGPLTQRGAGKYWRRSDLVNPTPLLNEWQDLTF